MFKGCTYVLATLAADRSTITAEYNNGPNAVAVYPAAATAMLAASQAGYLRTRSAVANADSAGHRASPTARLHPQRTPLQRGNP